MLILKLIVSPFNNIFEFNLYCSFSNIKEYCSHEKSIRIGQTIKIISIVIIIEEELIGSFKFLFNLLIISSLELFGGG